MKKITLIVILILGVLVLGCVNLCQLLSSNENVIDKFCYLYWGLAFLWSYFLGRYAFKIHFVGKTTTVVEKYPYESKTIERTYTELSQPVDYKDLHGAKKVQQFVLNFIGGITGFVIIYYYATGKFNGFAGWEMLILLVITYWSLTGYLPYMLIIKVPWNK